jgi:hypothetical protein
MAYRTNCPNCGGFVHFPVRDKLNDKEMSRELSLFLHRKTTTCNACGVTVMLKRKKVVSEDYTVESSYEIPLYNKAGEHVADATPDLSKPKKDSVFERVKIIDVG